MSSTHNQSTRFNLNPKRSKRAQTLCTKAHRGCLDRFIKTRLGFIQDNCKFQQLQVTHSVKTLGFN